MARADFFDASALLRIYSDEPHSDIVRAYFRGRATKYTTPFCFYEALNGLKSKWKFKMQFSQEQYQRASLALTAWYGASSRTISDLDFANPLVFSQTNQLVEKYGLDLSDAFQIMSVKHGYFSVLVNASATVLVTADQQLCMAARAEGLRVWNALEEHPPI
jgi:predicted nucleic acid-binding protein